MALCIERKSFAMGKRSKNIKHKCIHLQDMRLELEEAQKGKYLGHDEHATSVEKSLNAFVKLYGGSSKSVLK